MSANPAEAFSADMAPRMSLSLDGVWQFRHENGPWREAQVPSPWQAQFSDLVDTFGHAVYRRSFTIPDGWKQKELVLHFGAVSYFCEVFVNGEKLGSHEGAFLPFDFVLAPDLLKASNEIEVRVTMPSTDHRAFPDFPFAEVPHGKMSWYGRVGGLWQSVSLQARDRRHLQAVVVTAGMDGRLNAQLSFSAASAGLPALLEVLDADGIAVAHTNISAGAEVEAALAVDAPRLWGIDQPNLYTLVVTLGENLDRFEQSFGFRTIETRDGRILLNGRPIYMRGALDQDYYPDGLYTPPSLEFLEDQARKAKQLGLNTLRCHIKVPDPRYYDVAGRYGLLVWTEVPNVANFTTASARRMRQTMEGILQRDRNHPSIIAWTLINEDWGTRLIENEEHRQWLADSYDWLKQADPTRLVVDNSACFPNFHVKSDLNDFHYYRSVPERRGEWDDLTAQFAAGADWTYSPLGDAERRGDEPLIVSEFGVWGLPHPDKLRKDGREPDWFETGALWGDGVALPHGIEDRFAALDLHRTFGNFDDFIEQVQWYQFMNLRYEIEEMRRYASIMGYVITELTDVHWEANGLLDMERNPRVFHDVFGTINADIVIVPRPERYSAYAGENLDIALTIGTGGLSIPEGAVLRWSGEVSGEAAVPAAGPVSTVDLGRIGFGMPATGGNRMLEIAFVLESEGVVLARNTCEIALYSRRHNAGLPSIAAADPHLASHASGLGYRVVPAAEADIVLVHAVDGDDVEAIKAGARYLILADGTVETNRNLRTDMPIGELPHRSIVAGGKQFRPSLDQHLPGISLVERDGTIWRGDWIAGFSWLRRQHGFADMPGGPIFDLSFSDVVPHHLLTGFRPWEFGSNVIAGIICGWVHKPAAIIGEKRVGRGGVVATTFRLTREAPGADPVAAALFDGLVRTAMEMPIDRKH